MAIYMKIEGLDGNVTESKHPKSIEINSFRFGCSREISSRAPGKMINREASTVSISEVSINKEMDGTSPKLFIMACVGTGKTVNIDFCRTGANPASFATFELSNVLISNYGIDGGRAGSHPYENLTLNFSKITYKYIPYTSKGEAGSPIATAYDLETAISS